jgi:hypothetical protein
MLQTLKPNSKNIKTKFVKNNSRFVTKVYIFDLQNVFESDAYTVIKLCSELQLYSREKNGFVRARQSTFEITKKGHHRMSLSIIWRFFVLKDFTSQKQVALY